MSQRDEKALIKIVSETDFLAEALEGVSAGEFNGKYRANAIANRFADGGGHSRAAGVPA